MKNISPRTSRLGHKAQRILGTTTAAVAAATGIGVMGNAPQAEADIVYSGPVNIAIPDNIDGIYMNIVTGAFGATPPAGWDINPYSAVAGQFNLWGATTQVWYSPSGVIAGPYNLAPGTMIGGSLANFFRPGGGTNVGLQMNLNSSNNYLGFVFLNENTGQNHFGYLQLQFGATAGQRSIIGYGYESIAGTNIAAGAVPEPSTFAMLAAGALGLMAVRRFRQRSL